MHLDFTRPLGSDRRLRAVRANEQHYSFRLKIKMPVPESFLIRSFKDLDQWQEEDTQIPRVKESSDLLPETLSKL